MRCVACDHENPVEARHCNECGAALGSACPACGMSNPPGAKFCNQCAAPIANPAIPKAPERAPRDYTPRHLAEKILASKSAIEGERKQVTVLFADVKGSMELAEAVDAEEWHRILDGFFQILAEGVHRFEGTINQYTGDGIMALFGAPIAHEDHAQRACWAALELQRALRRYADDLRLSRGLGFSVRIGLNSGEVVVGKIGDDLRMDYTAQGAVVGLAARLQQLAEPGSAYLTGDVAQLVEGYFALHEVGPVPVKGSSAPVSVFELEGPGPLHTRLDVSRARGLSHFVGRADEMLVVESALARASAGSGRVVGVVAEPGVGKSRLCFEFAEHCRARGIPVYEAHAVSHGRSLPLLPVLELWRSYFGISEQDDERAARDKIAGRIALLDPALGALPLLFDLLGVPDPERPAPPSEAEARQRQLAEITRRVVGQSRREPAVFLIEDLHWIDAASEWFVETLVGALPAARALLLVTFRPGYHAAWMQRSWYQQLPLPPLDPEATSTLLATLIGPDAELAGLTAFLRERTGGNPFFIEEAIQSMLEHGALVREGQGLRLARALTEIEIPATVQAVLAARIDRLREREKQLLQTASVIGRHFSEPLLARVSELAEAERPEALRALVAGEFLYEESLHPVAEYAFRHTLTQEVAYRSQLGARRARVHARVARALEELDADRLGERAALLAHHWEGAGEAREAARWHRRAAEWADGNHVAEAMRHWRRVRELLDGLPAAPEAQAEAAVARAHLILCAGRVPGSGEDVEALAREGRALAEASGELRALAMLLFSAGYHDLLGGSLVEAVPVLDQARTRADLIRDPGLQIATRNFLSWSCAYLGRLGEALQRDAEATALGERDPLAGSDLLGYSPYLLLLALRAGYLPAAGQLAETARGLDRALELSREAGQLVPATHAHASYTILCYFIGDAQAALTHAQASVELAEEITNEPARLLALESLGRAQLIGGRPREASQSLEQALGVARGGRLLLFFEARMLASLAHARLDAGDAGAARTTAREALAAAARRGTRLFEIDAELALARAAVGDPGGSGLAEARSALDRAARLVEAIGARGHLPFVHEQRAALVRLAGDGEEEARELREAERLFSELGATGHLERLARGGREGGGDSPRGDTRPSRPR